MYYNKLIRVWVIDPIDFFILTFLMGSLTATFLKEDLSEKASIN